MWLISKGPLSPEQKGGDLSLYELMQTISRNLILAIGGIYLSFLIATVFYSNERFTINVWTIFPLFCLIFLLSLRHHASNSVFVYLGWYIGLAVTITVEFYLSHQPAVLLMLIAIPFMVFLSMGRLAGLVSLAGLILLILWVDHLSWMPVVPQNFILSTILGCLIASLLGWILIQAIKDVIEWTYGFYQQAHVELENVRDQQLEFHQVQEDLIKANQELARHSDRLNKMYQIAEEALQTKQEFVANVSHELRTPLNMIIGFSKMIIESPQVYKKKLPSTLLKDISAIYSNSLHLSKLVDDILDLSQINANRMALSKKWTSVEILIHETIASIKDFLDSKGLYLTIKISSDLPEIYCDGNRIQQVILNLLSNAIRFTDTGGITIRVWQDAANIMVSVTDTGPGIAPEDQEKLFEPFQQLDNSIRRRYGGSGLGLSISKRFVEMHDGMMWLESKAGAGTTFFIKLPVFVHSEPNPSVFQNSHRWISPHENFEYRLRTRRFKAPVPSIIPHFVVLEKGKTLQRLFSRYLDGYEISAVTSVHDALVEINRTPIQAFIINEMSLDDPFGLKENIKHLPYGTPAILCRVPGENQISSNLGVFRYLVKPISSEILLSTLDELAMPIKNILLVDDNQEALRLFNRILSSSENDYTVIRATNGKRALNLLRQRHPDVLLLDLMMGGMDGFQVLEEKKQDPDIQDIPVIVISSRDPNGEPVVSDTLEISKNGGLSTRDLINCIQVVSEMLNPLDTTAGPTRTEKSPV